MRVIQNGLLAYRFASIGETRQNNSKAWRRAESPTKFNGAAKNAEIADDEALKRGSVCIRRRRCRGAAAGLSRLFMTLAHGNKLQAA